MKVVDIEVSFPDNQESADFEFRCKRYDNFTLGHPTR